MHFDCWLLQVPVLSLMFLVLFVGNISTTIIVIPSKLKDKVQLRHSLTSQRISFGKNLNLLAVRTFISLRLGLRHFVYRFRMPTNKKVRQNQNKPPYPNDLLHLNLGELVLLDVREYFFCYVPIFFSVVSVRFCLVRINDK